MSFTDRDLYIGALQGAKNGNEMLEILSIIFANDESETVTPTSQPIDFWYTKKVKLIGIIFIVSFILFPGVRYNTGEAFHLTGDLIQRTTR